MPCSGGRSLAPLTSCSCARRAASLAWSASTVTNALMPGLTCSSRSSTASMTSTGEASLRRYIPESAVAGSQHSRSSLIAVSRRSYAVTRDVATPCRGGTSRWGHWRQPVGPPVGDHPGTLTPFDLNGAPAEDQEPAVFGPDCADGALDPDLLAGADRADEPDPVEAVVPGDAGPVGDSQQRVDQVVEQPEEMEALHQALWIPACVERIGVAVRVDRLVEQWQAAGVDDEPVTRKWTADQGGQRCEWDT